MKNYKVKITRNFTDNEEKVSRELGTETEEFLCTQERYEYLASCNGAVKLIEIIDEEPSVDEVAEEEVKDEAEEEVEDKPKKRASKK